MASDLPAGTFAVLAGTAALKGGSTSIPFAISAGEITPGPGRSSVLLRFEATTPDGGPVTLTGVTAVTAKGGRSLGVSRSAEGSLIAAVPTSGQFVLKVMGLRPGESVSVDVALAGDANGSYGVDAADLAAIRGSIGLRAGEPGYLASADVNGDGRVGPADLTLARRALGASTTARPYGVTVGLTASENTDGGVVDISTVELDGQTAPNTLVTLKGTAETIAPQTVSDATGRFSFLSVPLVMGTNTFTTTAAGSLSPITSTPLTVTRVVSTATPLTSEARMALFGLTNIQGLCYTPEPSDDLPATPAAYFDSDFWNSAFTPLWSSATNIQGFTATGGPVNGRGDLATMQSLGVNFLHLYDWNFSRDHTSFLAAAKADGMTVNVPISNYLFGLAMNSPLNPGTYQYQLETVEQIFAEVYPTATTGGSTAPNPAISMWTIANEPDLSTNISPGQVAQVAQMILYLENKYSIPDAQRLPIAVPLSWATSWAGYSSATPSAGAVEALQNAFASTTSFTATGINGVVETVPTLPADFFTTRYVWANNPVGNDNSIFLGQTQSAAYTPYYAPSNGSASINWTAIPMFFTEDGPSSLEPNTNDTIQAQILQKELAEVKTALGGTNTQNFNGAAVFQSLDQTTHKTGAESGFGIQKFKTKDGKFVYRTITDVAPTIVPPGGAGTWRLDTIVPKPAFAVVKTAFNP